MRRLLLLFVVFGALTTNSWADERSDAVDRMFAGFDRSDVPGASVLVMQNGEVVYARGYGMARLNPAESADAATNFRLASLTKQYTAMAVMILLDRGLLSLDDTLDKFFPDFPAYGRRISVRHLLNHTGGMRDYESLIPGSQQDQVQDADVLRLLAGQSQGNFTPGSQYSYSNSGYVVLGLIVAKVSGQSFASFLKNEIFEPLQMQETLAYEKGISEVNHRAYGYTRSGSGFRLTDQSVTSATIGDGGVYTSAVDWPAWERELRSPTLVSPATLQMALTPGRLNNGQRTSYGFGWVLDTYRGARRQSHTGSSIGFRTAVQRIPDQGFAVLVLMNRADVAPWDTAARIVDLYLFNDGR